MQLDRTFDKAKVRLALEETTHYMNLLNCNKFFNKYMRTMTKEESWELMSLISSRKAVCRLGKPIAEFKEFEYNPGAWVVNDGDIEWVIISDGHRPISGRGTSIELKTKLPLKSKAILDSFIKLVAFLKA